MHQIGLGNHINPLNSYTRETFSPYGSNFVFVEVGIACIDYKASQTDWPILVQSQQNEEGPREFEIPGTADNPSYIFYIGLRPLKHDPEVPRLSKTGNLVGGLGEGLVVAESLTSSIRFRPTPAVVVASPLAPSGRGLLLPPDDWRDVNPENGWAIAQMPGADPSLPSPMGEMPGWRPRLWNTNAAGTAVGTGMKSSHPKDPAIVVVEVWYMTMNKPVHDNLAVFSANWQ
jgi:hypothetical protein